VDKLTRKELKSDKFALEVQHSVEYVSEHRQQMIRWAVPAVVAVVIVVGFLWYRSYAHDARQEALHAALQIQNSQIGTGQQSEYLVMYPTAQARHDAVVKSWTELAAKYSGTPEAAIAHFFLGTTASDDGNLPEAVKQFSLVIDSGDDPYPSEAKLALAQIYAAQGKLNDGIKLVQSVMDHPTVMVSKDAATLAMADLVKSSDCQRAKKLVEPLRTSTRSAVSRAAITMDSSLTCK
jgi:predicted negative regulator of RcsB-dependent stress response